MRLYILVITVNRYNQINTTYNKYKKIIYAQIYIYEWYIHNIII